ncbi:mediator of RNA polymerase II transcription subunit 20 [Suhomyces tanzawaensis NRRL Y-17324]|uniref:Mediator of RNA polymerase II transcription subunit 20 n=1 Tax=Suhomyces tanzawaensis NRRL Y-17324 TaxID=984487 RepID=A0A1E4SHI3_9ASCO|nr:mediator of RNA polymerase II transcription subunit 20 [Suhomyces tanzawaensis NRRL Y-17324]ODV78979.1 mediator of RNA polymerase II transcription subunit 20 [Suhomyces tanzawaensis NRRL Y-17324]
MVTAVILVQSATPETITQFHDQLSNELPAIKGKWGFTFRIFRNNPYSLAPEAVEAGETTTKDVKYFYTLSPSYIKDSTITLIDKKSTGVFTNTIHEEASEEGGISIPDSHLHNGATTGLNDPFEMVVGLKFQSMWTQRQLIKGDGGQIYELENGNLTIRTSNVFLHGNFRGLLIQIDLNNGVEKERHTAFERVRKKYSIPQGPMSCEVLDVENLDVWGDLCLQYAEILNF